jgi:hypothetical protein
MYTLYGDLAKCILHGDLAKYTLYFVAKRVHRVIIISLMCTQSNDYVCRKDDSAHVKIIVPSWVQFFHLLKDASVFPPVFWRDWECNSVGFMWCSCSILQGYS